MRIFRTYFQHLAAILVAIQLLLTVPSVTVAQQVSVEAPQKPHLGVRVRDPLPQELKSDVEPTGVVVIAVKAGSLAERSGILVDDRILSLNDRSLTTSKDFVDTIQAVAPNSVLKFKIVRAGKPVALVVRF